MKKTFTIIFILCCIYLFANPIIAGPRLAEIYRDGEDWQITFYNMEVLEFTLDNCAISTNSGFSEFNDGIDFFETVTFTNEDLQDSLYIDWESDHIQSYYDDGNGMGNIDGWSFAPIANWSNSINPLFNGQSIRHFEPMMDYDFLVKDSNIEGGLRIKGYLNGYVYDTNNEPLENAIIKFYRTNSWLSNIFLPDTTDATGFFSSETFAKNYEVSVIMNNEVLIDTFLTVEPDSITTVVFYTEYDPVDARDHEIELPASYYQLTNHPNPFNPSTEISFQISDFNDQNLEIQIFNSKGQKITNLPITQSQNHHISIEWDGCSIAGKSCPSGVYLYKLVSGEKELAANKMLLLK